MVKIHGICEHSKVRFNRFLKCPYKIVEDNIGKDEGSSDSNKNCIYIANL